jgi:hypothetical protein
MLLDLAERVKEKTAKLYSTYIATVGLALYLYGHRPAFLESF